ncbi:MAG: SGNH/GDSL hydrolase family protein [Blastocatellia bacterium]|nr:SGNH/GDSL hydrolase family protein [Blastocatellia bacterium]
MNFSPSNLYLRLNRLVFGRRNASPEGPTTEAEAEREKPEIRISRTKQFLFSLIIFAVFLCLLEGALRLLNLPPKLKQDTGLMYRTKNAMGFDYTPGWSGYLAGAMVSINSFGFRGKEFSPAKPPGTVRILGIGDSFTFGMAVGDTDPFLVQMEKMLDGNEGRRYESINAGHQGMNTRQEYQYMKERDLLGLEPDAVILGFTMHNDAHLGGKKDSGSGKYGKILKKELSRASPILRVTTSGSFENLSDTYRLVKILDSGVNWIYQDTITEISYRTILEHYQDGSKSWKVCRDSLLGIYELCREKDIPLIVALFPIFNKVGESFDDYPEEALKLHDKLEAVFADKSGVRVVAIYDDLVLTGLSTSELRVPVDGHPNRLWHEIIARRLASTLKELGL